MRIRKGYLQEAIEKRREGEEEEEEENLAMVRRGSNLMFKSLYMPFRGITGNAMLHLNLFSKITPAFGILGLVYFHNILIKKFFFFYTTK